MQQLRCPRVFAGTPYGVYTRTFTLGSTLYGYAILYLMEQKDCEGRKLASTNHNTRYLQERRKRRKRPGHTMDKVICRQQRKSNAIVVCTNRLCALIPTSCELQTYKLYLDICEGLIDALGRKERYWEGAMSLKTSKGRTLLLLQKKVFSRCERSCGWALSSRRRQKSPSFVRIPRAILQLRHVVLVRDS